jgi:hypothetical protein
MAEKASKFCLVGKGIGRDSVKGGTGRECIFPTVIKSFLSS